MRESKEMRKAFLIYVVSCFVITVFICCLCKSALPLVALSTQILGLDWVKKDRELDKLMFRDDPLYIKMTTKNNLS